MPPKIKTKCYNSARIRKHKAVLRCPSETALPCPLRGLCSTPLWRAMGNGAEGKGRTVPHFLPPCRRHSWEGKQFPINSSLKTAIVDRMAHQRGPILGLKLHLSCPVRTRTSVGDSHTVLVLHSKGETDVFLDSLLFLVS